MRGFSIWQTIIGILIIIIGVVSLLNNLGLIAITGGQVLSIVLTLGLIALGVWLIQRAQAPPPVSGRIDTILGDTVIGRRPWELRQLSAYTGIGDTKIDLTKVTILEREARIDISGWIGDAIILVPPELGVTVHAFAGVGSITVFGRRAEGVFRQMDYTTSDFETAERKVVLNLNRGIGDILVTRVE